MREVPESHTGWTFLTNHSRVLAAIAENPTIRIRDIAARCRLTERAVQKIVSDLEGAGYLTHTRQGRSNAYRIEDGTILRHPADDGLSVAQLLSLLARHDVEHGEHTDGARRELQSTAPHARSPEDDQ
ncbi:helix-turn-helix domain-containing protein [Streptomyces sp. ME02-8801-2C]|uniref:helix-turn-helix transcriptional regulator n=1 Tax=Streptomyces sp. ME02-8801-2C TaxID=3028680 RepID=UPI0029BC00C9|nr:helix-turn-helix domain-containing protein [Streptomyces sp. ME02-8801-2C]MDX3457995.1 helix-turn-helix domain-containing protein [Streptomyces sp. ME02-8801-2C]